MKNIVDLDLVFKLFALIISCPTEVFYTNQTHGTCCYHPEIEGILIPLNNYMRLEDELSSFINDFAQIYTEDLADKIDIILSNYVDFIKVDRDKLKESGEAWLYVTIDKTHDIISGFVENGYNKAVLTWINSD